MTETTYDKPIPRLDDPDMAPFWQAAREHRLTAQRCTNCGHQRFPALPICPVCLERGTEWIDVAPTGTIWSFVVYHRAFHPGFKADLPYVVAIVENEDGLRYTGRVRAQPDQVSVGAAVRVVFEDATPEFTLPMWELA
jgi:uncharacterized protein